MSYFATLLRQTGIGVPGGPPAPDAAPSAPAAIDVAVTADAPAAEAAPPAPDLAVHSLDDPAPAAAPPSISTPTADRPPPDVREVVRSVDAIDRASPAPREPSPVEREMGIDPSPRIIETTVEMAADAAPAVPHLPIPQSPPPRIEGRRMDDRPVAAEASPIREEHEVRAAPPAPEIGFDRPIAAEGTRGREPGEDRAPAPVAEVTEEVEGPPRTLAEALAAARRWVSATPAPGERAMPIDAGRVVEEDAMAEVRRGDADRGGRRRERAAEVAHEEVRLSIGTLQVIVEDPAAQAPRPAPAAQAPRPAPAARPTPAPDIRARLRRHYLRVD